MKAKNLTKAFVRLFVVAIVIGVLVWPVPREAKADTNYSVFCWWQNGANQEELTADDITVEFRFDDELNGFGDDAWNAAMNVDLGIFSYTLPGDYIPWQVRYSNAGEVEYWGVNPSANPGDPIGCSSSYFSWQFAFVM